MAVEHDGNIRLTKVVVQNMRASLGSHTAVGRLTTGGRLTLVGGGWTEAKAPKAQPPSVDEGRASARSGHSAMANAVRRPDKHPPRSREER